AHAKLLSVGLNCSLGAKEMRPYIEELTRLAPIPISCYPNAGLPDALSETGFPEGPEDTSRLLREFGEQGWLNIVGGCCGTTPDHIRAIAKVAAEMKPRVPPKPDGYSRFSGLEALTI